MLITLLQSLNFYQGEYKVVIHVHNSRYFCLYIKYEKYQLLWDRDNTSFYTLHYSIVLIA